MEMEVIIMADIIVTIIEVIIVTIIDIIIQDLIDIIIIIQGLMVIDTIITIQGLTVIAIIILPLIIMIPTHIIDIIDTTMLIPIIMIEIAYRLVLGFNQIKDQKKGSLATLSYC